MVISSFMYISIYLLILSTAKARSSQRADYEGGCRPVKGELCDKNHSRMLSAFQGVRMHMWLHIVACGRIWLYMVVYECIWPYMAVYGCKWLYLEWCSCFDSSVFELRAVDAFIRVVSEWCSCILDYGACDYSCREWYSCSIFLFALSDSTLEALMRVRSGAVELPRQKKHIRL